MHTRLIGKHSTKKVWMQHKVITQWLNTLRFWREKGIRNLFSPTICCAPQAAEPSLVFSREEEKMRFCMNHVRPLKSPKPNFWARQACALSSIWFSACEHSLIDKLIVTTEPTVLLLLGLGSKLHPSKKQQMYGLSSSTPQSSKKNKGPSTRVHFMKQVNLSLFLNAQVAQDICNWA